MYQCFAQVCACAPRACLVSLRGAKRGDQIPCNWSQLCYVDTGSQVLLLCMYVSVCVCSCIHNVHVEIRGQSWVWSLDFFIFDLVSLVSLEFYSIGQTSWPLSIQGSQLYLSPCHSCGCLPLCQHFYTGSVELERLNCLLAHSINK